MTKIPKIPKLPWDDTVDDGHYSDAYDFLSLYWLPAQAGPAVAALRDADIVHFHPGDLLRAAELPPLPLSDEGVHRELVKAIRASEITPILCVNLPERIVIADGYHRVSLAYALAPFEKIPLKLAPSPKAAFRAP
jgi:hypothetical protein